MNTETEFSLWSKGFRLEGVFARRDYAEAYAGHLAEELAIETVIVEHEKGKVVRPA